MAIWFKIKKANLYSSDEDPWWFAKKAWATITFRKYQRQFRYLLHCQVDDAGKLKANDVFVTGTLNPPIFFVIKKVVSNKYITAVSIVCGPTREIDNVTGLAVVVRSARS